MDKLCIVYEIHSLTVERIISTKYRSCYGPSVNFMFDGACRLPTVRPVDWVQGVLKNKICLVDATYAYENTMYIILCRCNGCRTAISSTRPIFFKSITSEISLSLWKSFILQDKTN